MSEMYIKGRWKGKEKKVLNTFSPMIGMIYQGTEKFFGKTVVGVLQNVYPDNDEAVLKTKEGVLVSTITQTLKVIINE